MFSARSSVRYFLLIIFCTLIFALFALASLAYPGLDHIYLLFSVVSNVLLYSGFRRNAIFFDTFIGIFFWLGFWLKVTVRVAFMDGQFHEPTGNFSGSGAEFDRALLVASCGFLGLLAASYVREHYFFTYQVKPNYREHVGLRNFYQAHRKAVLWGFVVLFVTIAVTNFYFGIYQRGQVPRTLLPYGIAGIYTWLLLFGLASLSAMILHYEFTTKKRTTYLVVLLSLIEGFLTNISLLSRGMIINISALAYGVFRSLEYDKLKTSLRFWTVTSIIFVILFSCSIVLVNHLRTGSTVESTGFPSLSGNLTRSSYMAPPLFLDRWVGIEGVMAVSSYSPQDWKLWEAAWDENYSPGKKSFYDMNIITSPYKNADMTKHHYVSLPGILAFCFYPGSFPFLFVCMFIVGGLAAVIEICAFKLGGGNIILCALLAQVVAYRYAHFGYVPSQSYLLFGALFLSLFIIYSLNRFLMYWNSRTVERVYQNP